MDRTGDLRFGLPKAPIAFKGLRVAVSYGAACPQQGVTGPIEQPPPTNISEDCESLQISTSCDPVDENFSSRSLCQRCSPFQDSSG